jgi:hypothetical protein
MSESPIFIKAFEMLEWLLARTQKFPKSQRFVMAKRMEDAGLGLYDELVRAARAREKADALAEADFHLERLKVYNRLCVKLELLAFNQYEHLARELDEVGRLLGGWRRSVKSKVMTREGGSDGARGDS